VRSYRLARVAAQAELLRLRLLLRRQAVRALLAMAAAVFAAAALVALHVAGAMALAESLSVVQATLVVAGVDALIALILMALAARDTPGAVEREALQLRRRALDEATEAVVLTTLLGSLRRVRSLRDLYDILVTALAAWLLGLRR
jgi:hypothetical protein